MPLPLCCSPFAVDRSVGTLGVGDAMQVTVEFHPLKTGDHSRSLIVHYDTGKCWALRGARSLCPSKQRIPYGRSMRRYNNTLLSEELCFHGVLLFSVRKQQDLSLFSCVRSRDKSKALASGKLGKGNEICFPCDLNSPNLTVVCS